MKSDNSGTPKDSKWGFNNDGESVNTFGPAVKSTPNKVGADESISRKDGKGKITGGIENESIFGDIEYTGNTVDAGKKDYKSVDMKVFDQVKYNYDNTGFPADKDGGVFGTPEYAAKEKDKKVNGNIERDEASVEKNEGENPQGKRKLSISGKGTNPTSQNVKISTNILSKK